MTAFENATKLFIACEAPEGWEGCNRISLKAHLSPYL